jgi:Tol biopolymer transport system component
MPWLRTGQRFWRAVAAATFGGLLAVSLASAATESSDRVGETRFRTDPEWSPDGKQIAFVDHDPATGGDLWVMNADGSAARRLTSSKPPPSANYGARQPSWSPDGRTIAFGYGYVGISVVGADGTGLRELIRGVSFAAAWSPRGKWIAYAAGGELNGLSIYVIAPDGSRRTLVARRPCCNFSYNGPTWSPDGERMAFTVGPAPDSENPGTYLGVIDHFRGRVSRYAVGRYPIDPDWSPNGRRIVFSDFSGVLGGKRSSPQVAVLTLKTQTVRSLGVGWHPRWSPDGKRIAFSRGGRIWVMRADGSQAHALTP